VQHAHLPGIIHRDITPSNVLITLHDGKPVVKVIDFGIAKALGQPLTDKTLFTGFAQMLGTPLYMSPEQAALSGLDVDTRSDVYALGVLLYELLTGTTPFDGERLRDVGFDEIRRIIREEEPVRPSTQMSTLGRAATVVSANRRSDPKRLCQLFRGELDWIVMKALEKDRNRRYETAAGLAEDLERYLRDEPVLACPPSTVYRVNKFARRHKAGVAAAGLVLLCSVLLGGSAVWTMRERAARLAAEEQQVQRALDEATILQRQAKWPEALEAVRRAEELLPAGGRDELRDRARELRKDLETVLRLEAIRLPDVVSGSLMGPGTEGDVDPVAVEAELARAFRDYGIDVESLEPTEVGERVRARPIHRELALALDHWVKMRTSLPEGSRTDNDRLRKRLLAAARAADPDEWRNQLRNALEQGQTETLIELAASAKVSNLPLQSVSLLGWALDFAGESEQAVAFLRQGQRRYPDDFTINFQLGWSLDHGRHSPPVEQVKDEVIRFYTAARALRPRNVPVHTVLGHALSSRGRLDEAVAVYGKAIELNPDQVVHYYWYALAQLAAGYPGGYRSTCAAVLDQFGRTDKPETAYWAAWVCVLAPDSVDDPSAPVRLAEAAFRSDPRAHRYADTVGAALYRAGRFGEAARRLTDAGGAARQDARMSHSLAYTWFFLAMAHQRLGHREEARAWLGKAIDRMEQETRDNELRWNRRFTLQLLRREVESLVNGPCD
jgi:serine/threonine-protein kinase